MFTCRKAQAEKWFLMRLNKRCLQVSLPGAEDLERCQIKLTPRIYSDQTQGHITGSCRTRRTFSSIWRHIPDIFISLAEIIFPHLKHSNQCLHVENSIHLNTLLYYCCASDFSIWASCLFVQWHYQCSFTSLFLLPLDRARSHFPVSPAGAKAMNYQLANRTCRNKEQNF